MKRPLWAPWRIEYILSEKEDECFLCRMFTEPNDRENLVLFRGETCAVIMNRFPYNSGHLMIAPTRHIAGMEDLTDEESLEMNRLTTRSIKVLSEVMNPEGFNIGTNLGRAAGAGLEDHLHRHLVPRWVGDTNFMPVMSDTHVVPAALQATCDLLADAFRN